MNRILQSHIAIFAANLIFAASYTIAKEVMPLYIEPLGFILLRVSGAGILFFILYRSLNYEKIAKTDLLLLALCGLFGVAINQMLFFSGLNITTPINAAIIITCNPVMVLLIASWLIKEVVTLKKSIGIALGLAGAVLLITTANGVSFSSGTFKGDILILLNATSYAVFLVIVKPLMLKYSPLTVITWVFLFGFVFVLPFGYHDLTLVEWTGIPLIIWGAIIFVVLFATFLAYLLNIFALKRLSPTVVSYYVYVQPVLASAVALSFGKDLLSPIKIIAASIIFMGVFLVSSRKKIP